MPHPDRLVDITTSADTGASPRDPFSTPTILGIETSGTEPSAGYNNATRHTSLADVESSYGENSDIAEHAAQAFAEGTGYVYAIAAEGTSQSEVLGTSDSTTTSSGTVTNTPMSGVTDVQITVDGTSMNTTAVTSSPPEPLDGGSIETGEAVYNADTGEVSTGTSTSGSGAGIEVTYTSASWTTALDEAAGVGTDILAFASGRFGRDAIGDGDELVTWADGNSIAVPIVYPNGQPYGDVQTALDEAHDVGAYLTSKFGFPIASESADAIAGRVVGRFSVNEPWYDIYLKTINLSVPIPTRYRKYVGAPELPGTFEGGASATGGGDGGAGPANVLMDDGGTVLTNSLSLAGLESDYRYLDVARLEAFIRDRIQTAVSDEFRDNSIRFNNDGRTSLRAAIEEELGPHTGGGDNPIRSFTPYVPPATEVPEQARANRDWQGITVEVTISGYAHRAEVTLVITV